MDADAKLRNIVDNARGDDLERAQRAFGRLGGTAMDQQHGQSGRTRCEILNGYEEERRDWERAKARLNDLLAG